MRQIIISRDKENENWIVIFEERGQAIAWQHFDSLASIPESDLFRFDDYGILPEWEWES